VRPSKTFTPSSNSYSSVYRFIDLTVIFLSLPLASALYEVPFGADYLTSALIVSVVFLYIAESADLYRSWRVGRFSSMLATAWACVGCSFSIGLLLAFFLKSSDTYSRVAIALWFAITLIGTFLWRVVQRSYVKKQRLAGHNIKRVAIVGATQSCQDLTQEIRNRDELGFRFVGVFDDRDGSRAFGDTSKDLRGKICDAMTLARTGQIETLFIALPLKADKRIAEILLQLGDTTVDVHFLPDFLVSNLIHARISQVGDVDTLSVFESPYLGARKWVKRSEDVLFGCLILALITVPMLFIAAAIKLTSPGPVLFKQRRYGLGGQEIVVWKFRSMTVMENSDKVIQATRGDARITPLGGFLRRTSLDELPQFFNVLNGTMSIVGPRPHAVAHNEEYRGQVHFYMLRHKVKPGITGWAQINGWRGETDTLEKMEKRVEFDLQYIKHWSLGLDIKIILLTVFKGFVGKNAY